MPEDRKSMSAEQRRKGNVRLGLILASIAIVFFVGFIAKSAFFGI